MAKQQPQQVAVFIRQLLVSLVREIENCITNLDSTVYRTNWSFNSMVRYLGVNDSVSDQLQVSNTFTANVIFWPSKANTWRLKNISCNRNEPKQYSITHGK